MKKLRLIALILCVMLCGIIFSACGDKYKKLSMQFYLNDKVCNSVSLYIDNENNSEPINLEVKIKGIKESLVGDVQVYSSTLGLVEISNKVIDGKTFKFSITAINPTSGAELIVKHMASGKTASISLKIEKQSQDLTRINSNYVISIPSSGSKTSLIDSSKLFNLIPLDSTDKIYYTTNNSDLEGVEKVTETIDGQTLIKGFVCNSDAKFSTVTLYPVTVFNGKVDIDKYKQESKSITVTFFKTLKEGDLVISGVGDYKEAIENKEDIVLLHNDHFANNFVDVKLSVAKNLSEQLVYYTSNCYSSNILVDYNEEFVAVASSGDFGYKLIANRFFDSVSKVKFTLMPKEGYVGEIEKISSSIGLLALTRPETIDVYQQDKLVLDSNLSSIDIFNSYANANGWGSKFQFKNYPITVMDDFSKMRIVLNAGMLNYKIGGKGVNPIYEYDIDNKKIPVTNAPKKTYKNLLEFIINGKALEFCLNGENFISDAFDANDNIYIMYEENKEGNVNDKLQIKVESFYTGEKAYLKHSEPTTTTLTFNSKEGVDNFNVQFGKLKSSGDADFNLSANNWKDGLYFNRTGETDYCFLIDNVTDIHNIEITNTEFNIEVVYGEEQDNPLKLQPQDDGNVYTNLDFKYKNNSEVIKFIKNNLTKVGKYELIISHANGVKKSFNCFVYEQIKKQDILSGLALTDGEFLNNLPITVGEGEEARTVRPYAGYDADYLVAVGESLKLNVNLKDNFTNNYFAGNSAYVQGYAYSLDYTDYSELQDRNCLSITPNNNVAVLEFLNGTYLENVAEGKNNNAYVTLEVRTLTKKFNDIFLAEGSDNSVYTTLTFFIYPKASRSNFNLVADNKEVLPLNMLAYNIEDKSKVNILVNTTSGLLNYLQIKNQSLNLSGLLESDVEDKPNKIIWEIISNAGNWQKLSAEQITEWETANNEEVGDWVLTSNVGENEFATIEILGLTNNNLQFRVLSQGANSLTLTLKATIYQFGERYENTISVSLKKPILTEQLIVENLQYNDDIGLYVNVDAGSSWAVNYNNYSDFGVVTNQGVDVYIASQVGGVGNYNLTKSYRSVVIEGNNIVVQKDADFDFSNLKIFVFAFDRLKQNPTNVQETSVENYNDIIIGNVRASFVAFDLIVSTGSENNPYLIHSAQDFNKLNGAEENVYYQIMNDISLDKNIIIDSCNAKINTLNNNNYKVSVSLSNDRSNLFTNFGGKLANVHFVADYKYEENTTNNNLGVIGVNTGSLTDVSVNFSGKAILKNSYNIVYNFGALVGVNKGLIEYSKNIIGAQGGVTLSSNIISSVNFGGLVGLNESVEGAVNSGRIIGAPFGESLLVAVEETDNIVVPSFNKGTNAGSTVDVEIVADGLNSVSAVGGVIGKNLTDGKLTNLTATGSIKGVNNLGGIIGINGVKENAKLNFAVAFEYNGNELNKTPTTTGSISYTLTKALSSVVLNGIGNNLGGIVGSDYYGCYRECKYQILDSTKNELTGNQNIENAIIGNQNVGGIAGQATNALFEYCSVYSYKWDYKNLSGDNSTFSERKADIKAKDFVGGIVGNATSTYKETLTVNGKYENLKNAMFINTSSVNAYIESDNAVGGLLCINRDSGNVNVLANSYFLGKMEGNVNASMELVNEDANVLYRLVYAVFETTEKTESATKTIQVRSAYPSNFAITNNGVAPSVMQPWGYNEELNGGFIYLYLTDSNKPIFDIAPTGLEAKVKEKFVVKAENVVDGIPYRYSTLNDSDGKYYIGSAHKTGEKTITLEYYQFILDDSETNPEITLQHLNNWFNSYEINDLISFKVDPSLVESLSLTATSNKPDVVEINGSKLIVRGTGEAIITFTSNLNNAINATITINVIYPMGNEFTLTNQAGFEVNSVTIQNGKTATLYVNASGSIKYNGNINNIQTQSFKYRTNSDYKLIFEPTSSEYFGVEINKNTINIKANKAGGDIDVVITPSLKISCATETGSTEGGGESKIEIGGGVTPLRLKVVTATGPTKVNLDQSEAVVYPDYVYTVKAFIDCELPQTNAINSVEDWLVKNVENNFGYWTIYRLNDNDDWVELTVNNSDVDNSDEKYKTKNNIEINLLSTSYDEGRKQQTISFGIRFKPTTDNKPIKYLLRLNIAGVGKEISATANFNLLPQKIDGIEIRNFIYTNFDSHEIEQKDVVQPYTPGLITIDMLPTTGYYDYLEIKDITGGNQLISFAQIAKIDKNYLPLDKYPTITNDGLGIRLDRLTNEIVERIYVSTIIPSNFDSITHTIEVVAYLKDGTPISAPITKQLDVKLLPGVKLSYRLPDGSEKWNVETGETKSDYLAVGTNATFRARAINSNGEINTPSFTIKDGDTNLTNCYKIVDNGNDNYTLTFVGTTSDLEKLLGAEVEITFTTTNTLSNGTTETGSVSVKFTFVQFVINSVSLTSTRPVANYNEVYGNLNYSTDLEVYFNETDISFYDNGSFNNKVYKLSNKPESFGDNTALQTIYTILEKLNYVIDEEKNRTDTTTSEGSGTQVEDKILLDNPYFVWTSGRDENRVEYYNKISETTENKQKLETAGINFDPIARKLTVKEGYEVENLSVLFNLSLNENGIFELVADSSNDNKPTINLQYRLNFTKANIDTEPTLVKNERDFLAMSGKETNYILGEDFTLKNYTPMILDVASFDGNGHTITIESFAPFVGNTIEAGLFSEISESSMVMNLQVKYDLNASSSDTEKKGNIKADSNGTSFIVENRYNLGDAGSVYNLVNVGGLAVINNGIITNCKVVGTLALETPEINRDTTSIDFNIGGLVTTNSNTGYITNSTSALRIASMANVGGLVYENNGKISSSAFVARDETDSENKLIKNGLIYIYYGSSTRLADVNVAGFVVKNNSEILMSYVDVGTSEADNGVIIGNMSSKDYSAGFVYSNSGSISNSYINMDKFGLNNTDFDGFVHEGSGNVNCCYSYINSGVATNSTNLFAPNEVEDLTNCYVVLADGADSSTINNKIGIVRRQNMTLASSYPAFTFGDNVSAVWYVSNSLPKLVSCKETAQFIKLKETEISGDLTTYYGFKNITETKTFVDGVEKYTTEPDPSNYGTSEHPYIIKDKDGWNKVFKNENDNTKYFRLVKDINFESTAPESANITFSGNIQGNGMNISGINLFTRQSLNSIGLFANLNGVSGVTNAVRNINLIDFNINAIETKAVGSLAGVITNFNLYNVNLNSNNTILGNCAVGGLAGVIRGKFDVENVASNVSVNSSYTPNLLGYDAYISVNNNKTASENLQDVSYSGSVFGVADGYIEGNNFSYHTIKNLSIQGSVTAIGNIVGSAVGMVGELTILKDVDVKISGYKLGGYQYSGGVVGENRGVVDNASIKFITENEEGEGNEQGEENVNVNTLFNGSYTTSAGVVGLNLGGLVMNSSADIDIVRTETLGPTGIVAGVVGRNVNGSLYNCSYNGKIIIANKNVFEVTAGLVGVMYDASTVKNASNGLNKISTDSLSSVPQTVKEYKIDSINNAFIKNDADVSGKIVLKGDIVNCRIGANSVAYMLDNINKFYGFKGEDEKNFDRQVSAYRLFGLVVGVVDDINYNNLINNDRFNNLRFGWAKNGDVLSLVINGNANSNGVAKFNVSINNSNLMLETDYINVLDLKTLQDNCNIELKELNYLAYIIGHNVGNAFDSWSRNPQNGVKVMISNLEEGTIKDETDKIISYKTSLQFAVKATKGSNERYIDITNSIYIYNSTDVINQVYEDKTEVVDEQGNNIKDEFTVNKLYYTLNNSITLDSGNGESLDGKVYIKIDLTNYTGDEYSIVYKDNETVSASEYYQILNSSASVDKTSLSVTTEDVSLTVSKKLKQMVDGTEKVVMDTILKYQFVLRA